MGAAALVVVLALEGGPEGPPLQVERSPAFEVATVRPSTRDSAPLSIQRQPGGRLVTSNASLTFLIAWAFNLDDARVFGAPKGAESARFDIVAQPPDGSLPAGHLQLMMQALLTERFRLVVHRETRDLTAYTLVVDAGGPQVMVSAGTEAPGPNPFKMTAGGVLAGTRVNADMLATVLSNQLGRPVQNKTGINGVFDFLLQWRPDNGALADDPRPSLFTAIREQLGFRLEARMAPVDVVVIDRLELIPGQN